MNRKTLIIKKYLYTRPSQIITSNLSIYHHRPDKIDLVYYFSGVFVCVKEKHTNNRVASTTSAPEAAAIVTQTTTTNNQQHNKAFLQLTSTKHQQQH